MKPYPHHYSVTATASPEGEVPLDSGGLPRLVSAPPSEFGGPGDHWSPETFCVGAIADCFVLTFRAVARAGKLPWTQLRCDVEGTLDRVDRVPQFTSFLVRASLQLPPGTDEKQAHSLLERAEQVCLITNSLKGNSRLMAEVQIKP